MRGSALFIILFVFLNKLQAQDMQRVRKNLDTLCAPSMHGRGYVQNGDRIAAEYISSEFAKMDLEVFWPDNKQPVNPREQWTQTVPEGMVVCPSGTFHMGVSDTVYFQPFSFNINTFPGKLSLQCGTKVLEPGKDFIINPVSMKGKGKAKIVYLDTTILTNEKTREAFLSSSLNGCALVFYAKHYTQLSKLPKEVTAKMQEAKCLIELQEKKLTMSMSTSASSHPWYEVKTEAWDFTATTVKFSLENIYVENYTSQNVIGFIRGSEVPDSFIVITAHYDHLGHLGKNVYFPGANDNASGISMMLELGYHYSLPEYKPRYSMVFIAFSAEEVGLVGSRYFTQHPLFSLGKIKFLINLDLLGTGDDGIMAVNASLFPHQFERLTRINVEKRYLPAVKARGPAANSDHYWFSQQGVPCFFIYTLGGIAAYHDIYDRPETLPLTRFSEVFDLLRDFVDGF